MIIRINVEADPKARKLYRSQKIKQYTRKGLCKRARIKCTHVLTIYTGYRVPVRALITGTYCCRYVTKKTRHQDQHRHSVTQSYLYVQNICVVEPITDIPEACKLGTPASMNLHELWECRDLYAIVSRLYDRGVVA